MSWEPQVEEQCEWQRDTDESMSETLTADDISRLRDWFWSLGRYAPGWDDLPELALRAMDALEAADHE